MDDFDETPDGLFNSDLSMTPIDTTSIILNPKVDGDPVKIRCPECDAVIVQDDHDE